MFYHGTWNFSQTGLVWWQENLTLIPIELRFLTGLVEIIVAPLIFSKKFSNFACILGALTMFTALIIQIPNGYSYKYNGFEVALNYLLIFIYILLNNESFLKEKS